MLLPVTLNVHSGAVPSAALRIGYSLAVVCTYPLQLMPISDMVEGALAAPPFHLVQVRRDATRRTRSGATRRDAKRSDPPPQTDAPSHGASRWFDSRPLLHRATSFRAADDGAAAAGAIRTDGAHVHRRRHRRLAVRPLCLAGIHPLPPAPLSRAPRLIRHRIAPPVHKRARAHAVATRRAPHVSRIFTRRRQVGVLCGTPLSFILPSLIYLRLCDELGIATHLGRTGARVAIVLASAAMVAGTFAVLSSWNSPQR